MMDIQSLRKLKSHRASFTDLQTTRLERLEEKGLGQLLFVVLESESRFRKARQTFSP